MRWAEIPSRNDPLSLLIWALMFAIDDPFHSMTENISDMFLIGGEIGGDPGWEIHHNLSDEGNDTFEVWVDPRVSGIEEENRTYGADVVRKTTREILDAFGKANPDKFDEIKQLLIACDL